MVQEQMYHLKFMERIDREWFIILIELGVVDLTLTRPNHSQHVYFHKVILKDSLVRRNQFICITAPYWWREVHPLFSRDVAYMYPRFLTLFFLKVSLYLLAIFLVTFPIAIIFAVIDTNRDAAFLWNELLWLVKHFEMFANASCRVTVNCK
jgi:hypothetical protein